MKNLVFTLFLAAFSISMAVAQNDLAPVKESIDLMNVANDGPIMTFEDMTVDFGAIEQHSDPLRVIEFTNTGVEPLVIKNARGSCGCTVPIWPKEPIMPGETNKIEIRYDTKRLGKINKTVTLTTNEVGTDPHVIKVIGQISKVENDEGVPSAPNSILMDNPIKDVQKNEKKN